MRQLYLVIGPCMDAANAHSLWQTLGTGRAAFLYSGRFDDGLSSSLVALGEALFGRDDERTLRNRLTFIMVEAYQNIIRHRALLPKDLEQGAGRSLFWVQQYNEGQQVMAINPVPRGEAVELLALLHQLKGLNIVQLKDLFLRGLQGVSRSGRGGAGLGLIEMARRSGHELGHVLTELDADHQLFLLSIMVGATSAATNLSVKALEVHDIVARQDIVMAFQGRLTSALKQFLLRVVPAELEAGVVVRERAQALLLAAFELLHDLGVQDGPTLFAVSRSNGMPVLVLGLPVGGSTRDQVMAIAAKVRDANPVERQKLYRDTVLGREQGVSRRFLGLLDMARLCPDPLVLEAVPSGNDAWLMVRSCL